MWKHKLLNIESFIYQRLVNTDDMLEDCNQSMIYCINKDNSPEDVIDQLFDFPNLYCSDTCYKNEENKIIPCSNSCIDSCQNDNNYKYEYNGACYFFENHNDSCKDNSINLPSTMVYTSAIVYTSVSSMVIIKSLEEKI